VGYRRARLSSLATSCQMLPKSNLPWILGLATLTVLLHGLRAPAFWNIDDLLVLRGGLRLRAWRLYLDPDAYRAVAPLCLTPSQIVSHALDFMLCGLSLTAFHVHQLVSIFLTATCTFAVLRLWLPGSWAFLGAALFLTGGPVASVGENLFERHYIEGLGLALLSVLLFVRSLRSGTPWLAWVGALVYLAAATFKEIAVPVVVVLPFLPEGTWRVRVRAASRAISEMWRSAGSVAARARLIIGSSRRWNSSRAACTMVGKGA